MTHHRIINGRFSSGRLISLFIMGFDSLVSNIRVKWCMDPCYWMLTRPTLTNLDSFIYLVLLMSNQIDTLNKQIIIFPQIAYLVKLSSTRFSLFLGTQIHKFIPKVCIAYRCNYNVFGCDTNMIYVDKIAYQRVQDNVCLAVHSYLTLE